MSGERFAALSSALVTVATVVAGCSNDLPVLSETNVPPQVTILEPEEDTQAIEGATVFFLAVAEDDGHYGNLVVDWSSDRDGPLVTAGKVDADWNTQLSTAALTPGFHAVSVLVTDASGNSAQDTVNVRIVDVADAPTIAVERPGEGETGLEDVPFSFVVQVSDGQDPPTDLIVQLESSEDGYVCYLPVDSSGQGRCTAVLSVGTHLLTFTVADNDQYVTEATTFFDVLPNLDIDDDNDGWTLAEGDCDDTNASIHPIAPEIPYDNIDQDCVNGDLIDVDGDGYAAIVAGGNDCDDNNVLVSPGQPEVNYDGVDNDCNPLTVDDDADGDGWSVAVDCNDMDPLAWPGAVEIPYDGSNNDCDPSTRDDDLDLDGYPLATDCDDGNALAHPGAGEVLYDGIDNDCDPATRDDDLDGDGYIAANDCNDANAAVHPLAIEVAYDGIDNDCVGGDECDVDNDGALATAPLCGGTDCDDANFAITCTTLYSDLDGDGWGSTSLCLCAPVFPYTAALGGDCYDYNADAHPGQSNYFGGDRGDGSYDYNCSGAEELFDTRTNRWDCDVDYLPIADIVLNVSFDPGFIDGPPGCGERGTWNSNYDVTTNHITADCQPTGANIIVDQTCR